MTIYSYNKDAKYLINYYDTLKIKFNIIDLYFNNTNHINIQLKDIFNEYDVKLGDWFKLSNDQFYKFQAEHGACKLDDYFMYYRCQLHFTLFCSTTALGISYEHISEGDNLLKSIYKFHIYYHIR